MPMRQAATRVPAELPAAEETTQRSHHTQHEANGSSAVQHISDDAIGDSLNLRDWGAMGTPDLDVSLPDVMSPYISTLSAPMMGLPAQDSDLESSELSTCTADLELEPFIRAVEEMLQYWVRNGYHSFIDYPLHEKGMPTCLQDAFTTLATYVGDTAKDPGIAHFDSTEDVQALLGVFHSRGYTQVDTARDYSRNAPGASELRLGQAGAASKFAIHTKVHSGHPGDHEPSKIDLSITQSLDALQTSTVETMFMHVPDRQTPFEDTAKAMNEAFKQGKFRTFGLSNYSAAEVLKFIEICEEKGFVKPGVYQGHYNAIVRRGEKELFPLLRKHNIAFFAYSPAAGGLFSGNADTASRWSKDNDVGKLYSTVYGQPPVRASVATVRNAAEKYGINGHAAALRWTAFHSILDGKYGDGMIFAVSKMEQLHKTLDALEAGPLPTELAEAITAIYATVEGAEPPYHL
ncbi:aldo keto reductase [Seiridium cupressi]